MKEVSRSPLRERTLVLAFFFLFWFVILAGRLVQLQVIQSKRLKAEVLDQNQNILDIQPKRGFIFDRNGHILACSLPADSVFLAPALNEPNGQQLEKIKPLKKILGLSESEVQRIKAALNKKSRFIWIRRKLTRDQADQVRKLDLNGIFLQEENKRFYPQGRLAAHVLGGVSIDDNGLAGIEFQYNSTLQGKKGEYLILRDARRRGYKIEPLKKPMPGDDLHLTLDETIQYIAERELGRAVVANGADWGTVVISRPRSGEILAMASYPGYDPSLYPPLPEEEINRSIRFNFEPGSTFKIITAAAARELGLVGLSETFDCRPGLISVGRSVVRDHKPFGILSFPQVIAHSSNVGTILIGQRIGEDNLFKTMQAFSIGRPTGIDLPGEENGILRPPDKWSRLSLSHLSIGYEVSVTALQMLAAMNAIANRGLMAAPKIVLDTPPLSPSAIPPPTRVISEKTAGELLEICREVVEEGTGQAARLEGYEVAGKTGTTQKFDPELKAYSSRKHIASFVGVVPAEDPDISIIVVIDEPKRDEHYGGQIAAPVFREIARRVLLYHRIPPHLPAAKPVIMAGLRSDQP
jgi:cell division protein FtsI (penicillin-binding protein 3)